MKLINVKLIDRLEPKAGFHEVARYSHAGHIIIKTEYHRWTSKRSSSSVWVNWFINADNYTTAHRTRRDAVAAIKEA